VQTDPGILLTDLYELSMLQGYFDSGMDDKAVFEFFVRKLPPGRGYMVTAGLATVLEYLHHARFTARELLWLEQSGRFSKPFIEYLTNFRFCGDVHAMPEGSIFFPNEPVMRVTAPISQAQFVETRVINLLQYQILAATKASRCVCAAPRKLLVDFGLRRAHGAEAGMLAARSCFLAGFAGSSNVAAERLYGVPAYGTMAHSFIEAHDSEVKAFENFARAQPQNVVLLIDTYDTEVAARKLVKLIPRLQSLGIAIKGVRLDSGDLKEHALKVRDILDSIGLNHATIFASGSIDEYRLAELEGAGAPIDGFGIGSKLDTSADAPYLDCAYKLVEYAGIARRKLSEEKATLPGPKQVYRHYDKKGIMCQDIIGVEDELLQGQPLLQTVMVNGKSIEIEKSLKEIKSYHAKQMQLLPEELKAMDARATYPVAVSDALRELGNQTDHYIDRQLKTET
jgi:nicotinate phosphoribosyltransferase